MSAKIRRAGAALAAIVAAAAAAYLPALGGGFQLDDRDILASTWVRDLAGFAFPATWWRLVRPLTSFTFALDHALHGFDARGWHATSLALHLVATILAWRVARHAMARAGVPAREASALGAAAVFALHPLQTEAVSYISQRAEVLAGIASLAALLLLFASEEAGPRGRSRLLVAAAVACHALGLAAKPSAAAMPLLWLSFAAVLPPPDERTVPLRRRVLRRLPAALPLIALSAAAAVLNVSATRGSAHAGLDVPGASWPLYVATEVRALPRYLSLFVWPAGQNVDWDFRASASLAEPALLASAALVALLCALAAAGARKAGAGAGSAAARAAAFGFVFFVVALSPTLLVPLADPLAEHRAYLAALGFAIALCAGASAALAQVRSLRMRAAVAGSVALLFATASGTATAARNQVWGDAIALWRDAASRSPAKARPHTNLCRALLVGGDVEGAVRACDRALELEGEVLPPDQLSLRSVALALMLLGRPDDARARILRQLERSPPSGETLAVLATAELASGRLDEAERIARGAIARDGAGLAYVVLGNVLEARGDLVAAAGAYETAAQVEPWEALPSYALGAVQERRGRFAGACDAYARASDAPGFATAGQKARDRASRLGCSAFTALRTGATRAPGP